MRKEFYGDRKDVLKWSLLLHQARSRKILYVAMARPNRRKPEKDILPEVERFFERELSDVLRLAPNEIEIFLDEYSHGTRKSYFKKVTDRLRSRQNGTRYLIFLDPDTGIAADRANSRHICCDQLGALWTVLEKGDSLIVYQHQQRRKEKKWVTENRRLLGDAIGMRADEITVLPEHPRTVCFFAIEKAT